MNKIKQKIKELKSSKEDDTLDAFFLGYNLHAHNDQSFNQIVEGIQIINNLLEIKVITST